MQTVLDFPIMGNVQLQKQIKNIAARGHIPHCLQSCNTFALEIAPFKTFESKNINFVYTTAKLNFMMPTSSLELATKAPKNYIDD